MKLIIPCLISFLLTAVITPLVIRLATVCKCLDVPGGRRMHCRTTPRWGGAAFFCGVLPFLISENGSGALTPYIASSCLLVGMGMVDDLMSLGWKIKITIMTAAASIVIFAGDVTITHIGTFGSIGRLELGWFSIPFTFISIVGITNAINLLDGLNGLAGGVSLLGFLFMGIAALLTGNVMLALTCFVFVGALAGFLIYNFPNAKIFMGDTGSLFLGFSLAVTAVLLTQNATSTVDVLFPVLVLIIPIFDTLRVLIVRLRNGSNPFKADTLHLHYLLLEKCISPVQVTVIFWALTSIVGVIALYLVHTATVVFVAAELLAAASLIKLASSLTHDRQSPASAHFETGILNDCDPGPAGIARIDTTIHGITEKGGILTYNKWLIGLVVMLLAAHAFAETPTAPVSGTPQGDLTTPKNKGSLSKRNQAVIKQTEAAKSKNDTSAKSRLSKRNQAVIRQSEAAKKRNDVIQKSNAISSP